MDKSLSLTSILPTDIICHLLSWNDTLDLWKNIRFVCCTFYKCTSTVIHRKLNSVRFILRFEEDIIGELDPGQLRINDHRIVISPPRRKKTSWWETHVFDCNEEVTSAEQFSIQVVNEESPNAPLPNGRQELCRDDGYDTGFFPYEYIEYYFSWDTLVAYAMETQRCPTISDSDDEDEMDWNHHWASVTVTSVHITMELIVAMLSHQKVNTDNWFHFPPLQREKWLELRDTERSIHEKYGNPIEWNEGQMLEVCRWLTRWGRQTTEELIWKMRHHRVTKALKLDASFTHEYPLHLPDEELASLYKERNQQIVLKRKRQLEQLDMERKRRKNC